MSWKPPCRLLLSLTAFWWAQGAHSQTASGSAALNVNDPRPVAEAIQELVARYGYVITYEDPRHAYRDDLQDVTNQVRRDLDKYPSGKAPKVIVPRGGSLYLAIPSAMAISTEAMASLLNQLVLAQAKRGEGGHFRVVQVDDVFHVLPTEIRDRSGNWIPQTTILNEIISIPAQNRSEVELFAAIAQAISAQSSTKVFLGGGVGGGLSNPDRPQPYSYGANSEMANDALMRAMILMNDPSSGAWRPQRMTWQLLYDSISNSYALNLSSVPDRMSSSATSSTQQNAPTRQRQQPKSTMAGTHVPLQH